jgi:glucose/arabinose dehydrogenase
MSLKSFRVRLFWFAACAACVCFVPSLRAPSWRAAAQSGDLPVISLTQPIGGLTQPIGVTHAGDGSGRLFIIEQGGRIRVFKDGALLPTPFLDLGGRISSGGEQGLLGLAFPPDFASKGYFYVNYTLPNAPGDVGDSVVARYSVNAANPDLADPNSEQRILTVAQPFDNHNGGHLAFGPRDGFLYVALGDGGSGGDPGNRAQNRNELLGKLLRLDVETGRPYTYTVPPSNPFVGLANHRPEIWAYGLRNPWRFSFDRETADLFIGDVGQEIFEEIDFQPAASAGGQNYGWRIMEGFHCHNPPNCNMAGLTLPIWEYNHGEGCSVTGGHVYRGPFERMRGIYFYGDFCSGRIWGLRRAGSAWQNTLLLDTSINISSFGEDEAGNLYVASRGTGQVFLVVDSQAAPPPTPTPPAVVGFASANLNVGEAGGFATVDVTRTGNTSAAFTVDYRTANGTASERSDYTGAAGTLRFAAGESQKSFRVLVTNDDTQEGGETLRVVLENPTGVATIDTPGTATVTIVDNDAATSPANPIDRAHFFVRQHYFDFLNRFPDTAGENFWRANIESCGTDAFCIDLKRVDTSAAFFLSIEFQETGYLVYRVYKAAFGDIDPPAVPVPVRREDFVPDTQAVGRGVVVGVGNWQAQLEANKRAYLEEFVRRPDFVARYPTGQTPAAYVDELNQNAGNVLAAAERNDLVARLADGRETRATALRRVAEDEALRAAEFNRAFVLMQYFGYLRRNPNDPPDANFNGWRFWLGKLEDNDGDFRRAEMVKAFIVSVEYRRRFGQ